MALLSGTSHGDMENLGGRPRNLWWYIGGDCNRHSILPTQKISFSRFADICISSLPPGQAVGRWGNFLNQEAFGKLVLEQRLQFFSYATYIDALGEWHQATFFYESIWNIILLILLLLFERRSQREGILLPLYLIGYGLGRFWMEGLREDSLYLTSGIRVSQCASVIIVAIGLFLLKDIWKSDKAR